MDRSDLASKVFQCSQTSWEFWRDREITPFRQGPFNPPPKTTTCHSRRRRSGCPTFFNHQQHIPQAWKESEKKIPFPSPRTQETAATRSRSTSSRLAFGNATPEHVLDAASQMFIRQHSRGPRVSRIRCGGICLQF